MPSSRVSKVTPETITPPRAKRKSSMVEDYEAIIELFANANAWGKSTIIMFALFFNVFSLLVAMLAVLAVDSKGFDSWSSTLLYFLFLVFGGVPISIYVSMRALVIVATNRATYLKSETTQLSFVGGKPTIKDEVVVEATERLQGRPVDATANFDYTFGPFESVWKVSVFIIITCSLALPPLPEWTSKLQESWEYECGKQAFDKMMWETKTVEILPAIAAVLQIIMGFSIAIAWTKYMKSAGFDKDNSKGIKWFSYCWIFFYRVSQIFSRIKLLPVWVTSLGIPIGFLGTLFMNFYVDDAGRRKKKNLPPVTNNFFYMFLATTTIWAVNHLINLAKDTAIKSAGATAASIVVNLMGILFTFLFESLTVKASSPANYGPLEDWLRLLETSLLLLR